MFNELLFDNPMESVSHIGKQVVSENRLSALEEREDKIRSQDESPVITEQSY
jgi:hypothetical protein